VHEDFSPHDHWVAGVRVTDGLYAPAVIPPMLRPALHRDRERRATMCLPTQTRARTRRTQEIGAARRLTERTRPLRDRSSPLMRENSSSARSGWHIALCTLRQVLECELPAQISDGGHSFSPGAWFMHSSSRTALSAPGVRLPSSRGTRTTPRTASTVAQARDTADPFGICCRYL
jgi:hypothetical protein